MEPLSSKRVLIGLAVVLFFGVHVYFTAVETGGPVSRRPAEEDAITPSTTQLERLHHDLNVAVDPEAHRIAVTDVITLGEGFPSGSDRTLRFLLHQGLEPESPTPGVEVSPETLSSLRVEPPLAAYRVVLPADVRSFAIRYGGQIHHPVEEYGEDYAKRFGWTRGMIAPEGVYLTRGSGWYPLFGDALSTFRLQVRLPAGWNAVSQGERTRFRSEDRGVVVRWESPQPQDDIYLMAAAFHEYTQPAGAGVEAMVFLREPDAALAERYLNATAQYIDMYAELIGPYPYKKFALVENFWETGYGMPSFTLLGPTVLRLPFILHSSYPHEILHNWWGNGVYVNYESGNWSEGLTAYLSDHLIQEQQDKGADHRQTSLQKYADYVLGDRDFALTAFRSRHGSATEAVGYNKMMMFAHMLRLQLGDPVFVEGLRRFYRDHLFRAAGFQDLRRAFEEASGRDLGTVFAQWVERTGTPELRIESAEPLESKSGPGLRLVLEQVQEAAPYRLLVPLVVTLEGQDRAFQISVYMEDRRLDWDMALPAQPLRLDVDPRFDLMRRLDRREVPPALTLTFGAPRVLVLLPARGPDALRAEYRRLAESWSRSPDTDVEIRLDDEVHKLPDDRAVWLFGWDNRFLPQLSAALAEYDAGIDEDGARLPGMVLPRGGHAAAVALRHPGGLDLGLAAFAADLPETVSTIGRRLPHFHKYSYLTFQGAEGVNILKGRWPVVDSPMTVFFPAAGEERSTIEMANILRRRPLAELPSQD